MSSSLIFNLLKRIVQFWARRPSITERIFVLALFPTKRKSSTLEPSFCGNQFWNKFSTWRLIQTYSNAILLIGWEHFIDWLEIHAIVPLRFIELAPNRSLDFHVGELRPVERFQRLSRLRNVFLWSIELGWWRWSGHAESRNWWWWWAH